MDRTHDEDVKVGTSITQNTLKFSSNVETLSTHTERFTLCFTKSQIP